jgi:tetratricopeptide (TPR) repeat protein
MFNLSAVIQIHEYLIISSAKYLKVFGVLISLFFFLLPSYSQKNINEHLDDIEHLLYFYSTQGEVQLNKLIDTNQNIEEKFPGKIAFLKGILNYNKSNSDEALINLETAFNIFIETNNTLYQVKTQLILGWIAEKIGYWEQAKFNYLKIIELNSSGTRELALANIGMARCQMYQKQKLEPYLLRGITLLKRIGRQEYSIYSDYIKCILNTKNDYNKIILQNIATRYEKIGLNNNASGVYKSLGLKYKYENKFDSAHYYIDKALSLTNKTYPATSLVPALYQIKGSIYYLQKNYTQAKKNLLKAITACDSLKQIQTKYYAYKYLVKIDTINKDYISAFYNKTLEHKYYKKMHLKEYEYHSKLLEISLNVQKYTNINEKLRYRNSMLLIIFILCSCILILVILWVIIKNKLKFLKQEESKKALKNLLVGLGEKRLFYKNINELDIKNIYIKHGNLNECFEEAYYETIKSFKKNYTQLTNSDIRYAVMFTMGLSDDVIAQIRNVNIDSIQKSKRRMRKKLGLERGYDLQKYFLSSTKI